MYNAVDWPPDGLVIAIQYWSGDETRALRLARLLADIETTRSETVALCLARRHDCPESEDLERTMVHCRGKFRVAKLLSDQVATGHPDGSNGLWASTVGQLYGMWAAGDERRCGSVFTTEADAVPLRRDWIDLLLEEHQRALVEGKRVLGALMRYNVPHINGNLIIHFAAVGDRPGLLHTPRGQAWDLFHAAALMQEARPTSLIKNIYGGREWSPSSLHALSAETAWLHGTKDDSALEWAEANLRADVQGAREPVLPGHDHPAGTIAVHEMEAFQRRAVAINYACESQPPSYDDLLSVIGRPLTWRGQGAYMPDARR